jgi:hypothetical protein
LKFDTPERMPRDLWVLPWASSRYPQEVAELYRRYPGDLGHPPNVYRPSPRVQGEPYVAGTHVDDWGCTFTNIHPGVIGEVKAPAVPDLADLSTCRPPYETLPADPAAARDTVNRFCAESDHFVMASCCPRPWERLQFLRTSVSAMMDIMAPEDGAAALIRRIHEFHLAELEFWVSTDVDAIMFMDDWGAQKQLLIPPRVWRDLFRPLYAEYCQLAHGHGKFAFMHSDGYISEIYDDLIAVGVDALNSQLFTMDLADLARRAKGRITFWGEIDRQHVLPAADPQVARDAVRHVARHLYDPRGGIFVQFELGPGGRAANALAIFEEWDKVQAEARRP